MRERVRGGREMRRRARERENGETGTRIARITPLAKARRGVFMYGTSTLQRFERGREKVRESARARVCVYGQARAATFGDR